MDFYEIIEPLSDIKLGKNLTFMVHRKRQQSLCNNCFLFPSSIINVNTGGFCEHYTNKIQKIADMIRIVSQK